MKTVRISGTEHYAEEVPELLKRYESVSFADHHRSVIHLIPATPGRVLDIGAGTGRDAVGFVALGHTVAAVEPTEELRRGAMALHPSPKIEWVNDSLPDLALVRARGEEYDVIMLSAVWMRVGSGYYDLYCALQVLPRDADWRQILAPDIAPEKILQTV